MDVFFGFVLLVLTGAVVLLFAMFGELAARVGEPGPTPPWPGVRPLKEARIGAAPTTWPAELSDVPKAERALVLALSTTCNSCHDVARQIAASEPNGYAIALACPTREVGAEFVQRYDLGRLPHYLDEGGTWLRSELDVQSSPAGLLFVQGRLEGAHIFGDLKAVAIEKT